MIRIYTSPSCSSCRKVKKWFEDNKIPYEAKNIFAANLTAEELKDVISKTENGTDDIISNPSVLKRPIIVDDHRIQVGYNEEEIRTFIPRARRLAESLCGPNCEQWGYCNMSLLEGAGCPTGDEEKK